MNTGGSAFPVHPNVNLDLDKRWCGMTLRDYFAAKALPVAFKKWENYYHSEENLDDDKTDRFLADGVYLELIANTAYQMADAMLKAREQNG